MPPQQASHQYQATNRVPPQTSYNTMPNTAPVAVVNTAATGPNTQQSSTPQSAQTPNQQQTQSNNQVANQNRSSQPQQTSATPTTSTSSTTTQQTGQQIPQQNAQFNYDNQSYSQQQQTGQQSGLISTASKTQANVVVPASQQQQGVAQQQQGVAQQQQGVAQQPFSFAYGYPGEQHHLYYQDPNNPIPIQFIQKSAYPGTHQYNIYPQNWQQHPQQLQIYHKHNLNNNKHNNRVVHNNNKHDIQMSNIIYKIKHILMWLHIIRHNCI
jgi:hypothetical protein